MYLFQIFPVSRIATSTTLDLISLLYLTLISLLYLNLPDLSRCYYCYYYIRYPPDLPLYYISPSDLSVYFVMQLISFWVDGTSRETWETSHVLSLGGN